MATEFTDFELNDPELEALAMTLRENRPRPDSDFTERLDEAVADHFPPEWMTGVTGESAPGFFRRLADRFGGARQMLLPATAGLAGLMVVVVAVGIGINGGNGSSGVDSSSTADMSVSSSGDESVSAGSSATESAAQAPTSDFRSNSGAVTRMDSADLGAQRASGAATGPFAAGVNNRKVAQEAEITLGTKPENVQDVSNDVIEVVDDHNGIVLDSSVVDGPAGKAGASFSLMIPSARLESAIAELSGIADLRARNQETEDITAPTLTVQDSLQTARARVESLVNELAETTTEEDRARIEDELGQERRQVARITTRLNNLERRANLTPVAVKVETGGDTGSGDDDSSWGIGDALDDAAKMLSVSAGVALVALAVAIPIGLMVLLALALNRAWIRRSRRRALEEN